MRAARSNDIGYCNIIPACFYSGLFFVKPIRYTVPRGGRPVIIKTVARSGGFAAAPELDA